MRATNPICSHHRRRRSSSFFVCIIHVWLYIIQILLSCIYETFLSYVLRSLCVSQSVQMSLLMVWNPLGVYIFWNLRSHYWDWAVPYVGFYILLHPWRATGVSLFYKCSTLIGMSSSSPICRLVDKTHNVLWLQEILSILVQSLFFPWPQLFLILENLSLSFFLFICCWAYLFVLNNSNNSV
jgi:hypothetical protein